MQNLAKLMLLALWFACCQATAATPADLYDAEAVVADEGVETRNATLSRLLGDVLVRVSGNARIGAQPAAREVLDRAPSLVEQYRYRTADQDGEVQRILWARFDRGAVERMLRERNLPVWVQRPRVLLWVATERGGRRALLNLDNLPEGRAAVLARAQQRGMPLQLPLMDLVGLASAALSEAVRGGAARVVASQGPGLGVGAAVRSAPGADRGEVEITVTEASSLSGGRDIEALAIVAEHGTYALLGRRERGVVRAVHAADPLLTDLVLDLVTNKRNGSNA